jgi:hypothetical protein
MENKNQITVTVSGVLTDLNNGMSRKEIKTKYQLNNDQMKQLFSNENLKGRKAKKSVGELIIIDDIATPVTQREVVATKEEIEEAELVATI